MTRKDYIKIAQVFRVEYQYWLHSDRPESVYCLDLLDMFLNKMCSMLKADNANLKKDVFIEYIKKCECTKENFLVVS